MISPQSRDLAGLCPCVRRRWAKLVEACHFSGFDLALIETIRQPDRQAYYVRIGASKTMDSKHLPQPPHGLSLAVDVCPREYLSNPLWHPEGELWDRMGGFAKRFGLLWGGDWPAFVDRPHCYLDACLCAQDEEENAIDA